MPTSQWEIRALTQVTEEARRDALPDSSHDDLERRILAAVESPAFSLPTRPHPARRFWLAVPAVALAAAASVFFLKRPPEPPPSPSMMLTSRTEMDGDALTPQALLTATTDPLEVVHEGRARWVLEPGSRARVLASSPSIRVRLLSGSLRADVTPGPNLKRFLVEALETEILVHGTVFRVKLEQEKTLVSVDQGVVGVRSRRFPSAKVVLLKAPASALFSPDGAPSVGPATPQRDQRPQPIRKPLSAPSSPQDLPIPSEAVPREPTIGEVEAGMTTVVQAVTRCFEEHTTQPGNGTIRVQTAVTLEIAPDGTVNVVRFAPPLSPSVQTCAERETRTGRFAPAGRPATITRVLELSR